MQPMPPTIPPLRSLGEEPYVSFTTFRRTGEGVATPVWIARDGDDLVFTTDGRSGKAKRIRNDGAVTLQACSRTGEISDAAAPPVPGRAALIEDHDGIAAVIAILTEKYGAAAERIFGSPTDPLKTTRIAVRIRAEGSE